MRRATDKGLVSVWCGRLFGTIATLRQERREQIKSPIER